MQKIDDKTNAKRPVRAQSARQGARSAAKQAAPATMPPALAGPDRTVRELADATSRFTARRLRDSLPGKIVTPRLVLRAPIRGDVPDLVALANNRTIAEKLARLPHPYGSRDALAFIEVFAQRPDERPYAITVKDRLIGVVGLTFTPDRGPELGYWLGQPHWGHGYMTEAAKALVDAAFATGGIEQLGARVLPTNRESLRVLAKLGFVETGRTTSCHVLGGDVEAVTLQLRRPKWI